jgi:hypothetical protein
VVTVSDADFEDPFQLAVMDTGWSLVTIPAVAANVAVLAPAAMFKLDGVVTAALLRVSVTTAPPAGAPPLSVTVHDAAPPALRIAGAQVRDPICTETTRFSAAVRL